MYYYLIGTVLSTGNLKKAGNVRKTSLKDIAMRIAVCRRPILLFAVDRAKRRAARLGGCINVPEFSFAQRRMDREYG